jgi:pimeloyl-ACP methyl ester carboxylesterase
MARLLAGGAASGVRLVGIDRPGSGLSDFKPGWRMLEWPGDVVQLGERLTRERFAILGWSGGAPYAAACAYQVPDQISACGLVASMGPADMDVRGAMARNQIWRTLAQRAPWSLRSMLWLLYGRFGHDPAKFEASLVRMQAEVSEPDRQVYARPEIMRAMAEAMAEAFRQGMQGQAYEARLLYSPWGFDLGQMCHSQIRLWHGEQDWNIPPAIGRSIAAAMHGSQATFYPDEGHLSILVNRAGEILGSLVA